MTTLERIRRLREVVGLVSAEIDRLQANCAHEWKVEMLVDSLHHRPVEMRVCSRCDAFGGVQQVFRPSDKEKPA